MGEWPNHEELNRPQPPSVIHTVWVFPNGMVAVCDQYGQQMPQYQGTWAEKIAAIKRDAPLEVIFRKAE